MRQVKDHVCPGLARRVPTICVLLIALFQERVGYFTVYMLLLQDTTITEQNKKHQYQYAHRHQETPPNYKDVLFSRCFKMTCKMFFSSKRCFKFWKHLEHVQKVFKMFWIFKVSFGCFKTSFRDLSSHQRCPISYEMFWLEDVLIRKMF